MINKTPQILDIRRLNIRLDCVKYSFVNKFLQFHCWPI